MSVADRLSVWPQYLMPQHALSRLMLAATRVTVPAVKNRLIKHFLDRYAVDMREAAQPDPFAYESFNAFFTRALADDARPVDRTPGALVAPADGTVSQLGRIDEGEVFQAKGMRYTARALLAGSRTLAARFANGCFATIYLAPSNYHRVHMPAAGRLVGMHHVPGRLFSVNERTARVVPRLFARNERTVSVFETDHGAMAVVLVGAFFVGCIEHAWCGVVTPRSARGSGASLDDAQPVSLEAGQEMGRFNMGSTVVLLHENANVRWDGALAPGSRVCMGQRLGQVQAEPQE